MIDVTSIEVREQAVLVCLYFAMLHSKDERYHEMTTALMTMSQRSDINYNTLKNYKDCFDPLFDNGRKGWHQKSLEQKNSYLVEIHQKYSAFPLEEVEKAVKTILNNGKAETERSNVAQGGESMNFSDAILLVKDALSHVGSAIAEKDYDGLMVKALSASNTLDVSRGATKQTHIAITGPQIDMFPYLRADGYFEPQYAEMDGDLKKYYIPAITVYLDAKNIFYLANGTDSNIVFGESVTKETHMSVLRSRRKDSSDQIELGHPTYSSADFVSFRKLIHTNDYLILLKRKGQLVFEGFGISASQNADLANSLSILNNKFFKNSTSTLIDVNAFNDGYYADNTEFLQDLTSKSAAAYSPRRDAVVYNDSLNDFWLYDFEEVITHELAHRADNLLFRSVDNEKFSNAISVASKTMLEPNRLDAFLSKYAAEIKDPCFSDIISALFVKRHPLIPAGHSEKYWSVPGNKEREIFAELFTLQSLRSHRALQIIENEFPELYRTYLEMLREVDIV